MRFLVNVITFYGHITFKLPGMLPAQGTNVITFYGHIIFKLPGMLPAQGT